MWQTTGVCRRLIQCLKGNAEKDKNHGYRQSAVNAATPLMPTKGLFTVNVLALCGRVLLTNVLFRVRHGCSPLCTCPQSRSEY